MTVRTQPPTFSVIELSDVDRRSRWFDFALGTFSRMVLFLLVFATLAFLGLTFSSSALANALTPHKGPVYIEQRMSFLLAAMVTGAACAGLGRGLNRAWSWARLPSDGGMRLTRAGIIVTHQAVLDGEVRIPWENIKAIALDSGANHDARRKHRRFPIPSSPSSNAGRKFLYDTSGDERPDFALVASRPTAPNVAFILDQPLELSNPNAETTRATFADSSKSVAARPPNESSVAAGLFLRARNLETTRSLLLPTGKLRALRSDDVS